MQIFNSHSFAGHTQPVITCSLSPKDTHGPIVKSGPTAGQNRSRNKNGQWRKKRSDAGMPRS